MFDADTVAWPWALTLNWKSTESHADTEKLLHRRAIHCPAWAKYGIPIPCRPLLNKVQYSNSKVKGEFIQLSQPTAGVPEHHLNNTSSWQVIKLLPSTALAAIGQRPAAGPAPFPLPTNDGSKKSPELQFLRHQAREYLHLLPVAVPHSGWKELCNHLCQQPKLQISPYCIHLLLH